MVGSRLFSALTANMAAFFVEGDERDIDAQTTADLDARLARTEALVTDGAAGRDSHLIRGESSGRVAGNAGPERR